MTLYTRENKEPPCDACWVELDAENQTVWKLFSLCSGQVLRAGMDGIEVGLDYKTVISIIDFYTSAEEDKKQIFEDIRFCYSIKQEFAT